MQYSTPALQSDSKKSPTFLLTDIFALANSLFHEGRLDDTRDLLSNELENSHGDHRLAAATLLARTEWAAKNYYEAQRILVAHYPLADASTDDHLRAWFHSGLGVVNQDIARFENYEKHIDMARFEYVVASTCYEKVGDLEVAACVECNLGYLSGCLGRYDESRAHYDRARGLLKENPVKLAEFDHSQSKVCLQEGNTLEAVRLASSAVSVFAAHEEKRLLLEARPTLMKALNDYQSNHL